MNPRSYRLSQSSFRLLVAALCCVPLGSACSSDDAAPLPPTTFGVEVTTLDGQAPDAAIELRCDRGGPATSTGDAAGGATNETARSGFFSTLAVGVATTPTDAATQFVLRPAHACGSSTRCGYVRIEGLDDAGQVLTSVDTSTTEGVLELDLSHLPSQIRVSLIRGLDQEPLKNPDKTAVTSSIAPSFVVPTCVDTPSGGGTGGAGGAGSAGDTSMAGADNAGGASTTPGAGGAGGAGGAETVDAAGADGGGAAGAGGA
ncbi:MAG: hypothetical protein ABUL60_24810 [Myxococcales bacterium]